MNNKKGLLIFVVMFLSGLSYCQLTPIFQMPGVHFDSASGKTVLKQYSLEITSNGSVIHNDSLIFEREGLFLRTFYEIFHHSYLVITPIDSASRYSAVLYGRAKRIVKMYNLKTRQWINADLEYGFIDSINEKWKYIKVISFNPERQVKKINYR